ncbi:hypothetical protein GCK32_012352 [Trichostrongylus colubriformis]|uniref:Uncharacterized protein n=1 Tax=Trichostrongylus colubriformis TaxID=6319 RepID=A0AAN8FG78_TRICO
MFLACSGCGDNMVSGERTSYSVKESSAHEILATAFKAIHQTTMMMVQTRNAIIELLHNLIEECNEDEEDQEDSVDEEEEFNRQMEQAIQESCQDVQSSSRAVH